jgi:hypothetical protein
MHADGYDRQSEAGYVLTGQGRGQFHETDPRTGREPAGSGLLARAAAVRQAQEGALAQAVTGLAAQSTSAWARASAERLDRFVAGEIVPRIFDFIDRRMVTSESRDDRFYSVTLEVIFDIPALNDALEKFDG